MWAAYYAELRRPLTTLALKLQRKQKKTGVQSGVCFVCSHGGLPLDAFIISLSDATSPRGGDVTAGSMSNMKEREAAAKDLWGETNLTRSVLRWEARRHHVARSPRRLHIRPPSCQPTKAWRPGDADSAPHASVYVSVTLCLISQSIWKAVKWTKCSVNKGSIGILRAALTARSSCGNVKQGWDERSVASGAKLLTPHFLLFPVLKLLLSRNVLYMHRALSLVTCAFHSTSTGETQHMLSRELLLVSHLFCCGSMLFVWTCAVFNSPNLFSRGSSEGRHSRADWL